jgi:hypothetical protein
MTTSEGMKEYLTQMSNGEIKPLNMNNNQRGYGIGGCERGRSIYRIPPLQTGGAGPTIVSPVQQALNQAKSAIGIKRKRSKSRSQSRKRRRRSKSGGRKKKKKSGKAKKTRAKKTVGRKKKRKRGKSTKTFRDIFA